MFHFLYISSDILYIVFEQWITFTWRHFDNMGEVTVSWRSHHYEENASRIMELISNCHESRKSRTRRGWHDYINTLLIPHLLGIRVIQSAHCTRRGEKTLPLGFCFELPHLESFQIFHATDNAHSSSFPAEKTERDPFCGSSRSC